jgi:hypothetical protein
MLSAFCFAPAWGAPSPSAAAYVKRLRSLEGTPYSRMNCYAFVCLAHGQSVCTGMEMLADGCKGRLSLVGTFGSLAILSAEEGELQSGDVVVFWKGGHVAAYLGEHTWCDESTFGAQEFHLLDRADSKISYWYHGPMHVYRWAK